MLTGDEVRAIHDELWLDPDDDAKACVSLIDNHGPFLASLVDAHNASGWACDENFPSYIETFGAHDLGIEQIENIAHDLRRGRVLAARVAELEAERDGLRLKLMEGDARSAELTTALRLAVAWFDEQDDHDTHAEACRAALRKGGE